MHQFGFAALRAGSLGFGRGLESRRARVMPASAVRSEDIELAGPAGKLEAVLERPARERDACALVCHPHPLYQGTMHNKVAYTLARSFVRLGAPALRFNFRGVGASAGEYGEGRGEVQDALAAAAWLRGRWPGRRLYLAGFSFGAGIALKASAESSPAGLVTVAPPLERMAEPIAPPGCRWLVVQGRDDELVSADGVAERVANIDPAAEVIVLPKTDHFFHGRLNELRSAVMDFFAADFAAPSGERAC